MPRPERLLILLALLFAPVVSFANSQIRHFAPGEVSGRKIASFLALTCSKENWASTAGWMKSRHMISKTNSEPITLKITSAGAEIEHPRIVVRILGDLIEARFRVGSHEKAIAGRDTCELMNKARGYKAMTLLNPLLNSLSNSLWLPEARAENIVDEERGQDEVFLGMGLATLGAGIIFPPAGLVSAAFFLWNAYDLIDSSLSLATKRSYEDILNSDATLECSESQLTLKGANGRIVVKKAGGVGKIGLFGKESETPFEGSSEYAPKSSAYLIKLANDCHDGSDARRLMAQMKTEREGASSKIAEVDGPTNSPPASSKVVN